MACTSSSETQAPCTRVGYARAGRLIDEMEQRGIIDQADGSKPRNVLITREQMNEMFEDGDEE